MSNRCRSDAVVAPEDRAVFVRENAVSLLEERDRLITRLRRQVTMLLHSKHVLRCEVAKLRGVVQSLAERVAKQSDLLSRKAEKSDVP
jgi:hypothetical protein